MGKDFKFTLSHLLFTLNLRSPVGLRISVSVSALEEKRKSGQKFEIMGTSVERVPMKDFRFIGRARVMQVPLKDFLQPLVLLFCFSPEHFPKITYGVKLVIHPFAWHLVGNVLHSFAGRLAGNVLALSVAS